MIFRGRFEYTIDPKGRVNIPAPFRDRLQESAQGSFFLTNFSDCLYAFAADDWARIEERLSRVPSTDRKMNAFVRFFLGGAVEVVPDKQGRILVPPSLRSYAGLEKDVVILGMPNRFEIWSLARWQEEIGRFEKEVHEDPGLAREISALGSEAWRPLISPFFYKRRWKDWHPLPAGSSSTGRPGPAGTRRRSPRGSAPGVFWSAPTRTPRCSRSRAGGSPRSPGCGSSMRTSRTSTALREAAGGKTFDGALLDLGISSLQLDDPSRGSRSGGGSLDMRRDPDGGGPTAAEILRDTREKELADLFYRFGEERFSGRIARAVVERRKREADPNDHRACGTRFLGDSPEGLATGHSPRHQGVPGAADRRERGTCFASARSSTGSSGTFPRGAGGGDQFPLAGGSHGENGVPATRFRSGRRRAGVRTVDPQTGRPVRTGSAGNPRARSAKLRVARRRDGGD